MQISIRCILFARLGRQLFSSRQVQSYTHLSKNRWLNYDESHKVILHPQNNDFIQKQNSLQTHKSNAEQLIHRVPVIEVDTDVVRCMGGTELNAGHPQVYIMLNTRTDGQVQSCKYCGLRYQKSQHSHH